MWASLNPTGDAALVMLLDKIHRNEDLLHHFEEYYLLTENRWSPGAASYFRDWMERKRDQIDYEKHRVSQIGLAIAAGRDIDPLDI